MLFKTGDIYISIILTLLLCLTIIPIDSAKGEQSAHELYRAGEVDAARNLFKKELSLAEQSKNKSNLWQALMSIAWFEDEIGEHRAAIEHSNRALELANSLKSPFMIGRSLAWLGWAYSSMGLYQLAIEFYQEAVEIGAPGGEIKLIPVWGLATQELGAIYYKMGDIKAAKDTLTQTVEFARERGISIGLAEGGVHLAEIALAQGDLATAENFAKEAVQAALQCNCSQFNIARARVTLAKVVLERSTKTHVGLDEALQLIDQALQFAEKSGNSRPLAEAKILLSKTLPASEFQKRFDLVASALEILENSESELRGTADSEFGKVFLADNQLDLAKFYLKQGLRINNELFRRVDSAYILADLGTLHQAKGEVQVSWKAQAAAADRALGVGALPLALEQQEKLAQSLEDNRYTRLALKWRKHGLQTIETMLAQASSAETKEERERMRLEMMDKIARLELSISFGTDNKPKISLE